MLQLNKPTVQILAKATSWYGFCNIQQRCALDMSNSVPIQLQVIIQNNSEHTTTCVETMITNKKPIAIYTGWPTPGNAICRAQTLEIFRKLYRQACVSSVVVFECKYLFKSIRMLKYTD